MKLFGGLGDFGKYWPSGNRSRPLPLRWVATKVQRQGKNRGQTTESRELKRHNMLSINNLRIPKRHVD